MIQIFEYWIGYLFQTYFVANRWIEVVSNDNYVLGGHFILTASDHYNCEIATLPWVFNL
jgi:hypothetical protein